MGGASGIDRKAGETESSGEGVLAARQAVMATLARADASETVAVLEAVGYRGPVEDLRAAGSGLVMLRGRMGGDGRPFNLGEASVARAAVRLGDGRTGFSWQLGRDVARARQAAILDALWQGEERGAVETALAPLRCRQAEAAARKLRRSAATRVNFFTMVRGEDE